MRHTVCLACALLSSVAIATAVPAICAAAKPLPTPFVAPVNPAPPDPAHHALVAALAEAKAAGDAAAVLGIEARLGAKPAMAQPPHGAPVRLTRFDGRDGVAGGEKWGGDVLVTGLFGPAANPSLVSRGDGTLYAACEIQGPYQIVVFRSRDHGASWEAALGLSGEVTISDPCLLMGEGTVDRLVLAYVYASGTVDSSIQVYTEDFDTGAWSVATALANPYLALAEPRLCADCPEYGYWYPYLVCRAQAVDRHRLRFTRSLDYGASWVAPTTLDTELDAADLADLDFGGTVLTVVYSSTGADADVHARQSRDFGGVWEPGIQLTGAGSDEIEPRVAATASGDVILVAFAREYGAGNHDIDALWSSDQGGTWSGAFLPYDATDERSPALAASPVDDRLYAAYRRGGRIVYTAADQPYSWEWSPALRVDDRGAAADARPALATRPQPCACAPDLNCDGLVDFNDLAPFEMAMNDPYGYDAAYPDCDRERADLDCDGDIDVVDYEACVCLLTGGQDCCPDAADDAAVAWHDGRPPTYGVWFDSVRLALPPPVDDLLICADAFAEQTRRLSDYRRSRGLTVAVVELSDIAEGTPTAAAIDAWLESYWDANPRLRFVTLIGGVEQLPAFPLVYPETGEPFFSDLRYACRDATYPADYLPQLAVGRLPVATSTQLDAVIDKIERFEAGYGGGGRVLFFGNQPEMSYVAARDSALAASLGYAVTTLYSPTESALMAAFNAPDPTLTFYYGHGSASANWPLHTGNLDLLTNHDRPWLYFSGGCSFNDDTLGFPPLGHTLLFNPGGPAADAGAAVAGGYGYAYEYAAGLLFQSRVQQTYGELTAAALAHLRAAAAAAGQDVGPDSSTRWFAERLRFIGDPALRVDGDMTAAPPPPSPTTTMMRGVHPNPFNAAATVDFTLPADSGVRLAVYAATGRRVAVLVDGYLAEGDHEAVWHGRDQRGRNCPSAVYFLRLEAAGRTEARRIVLVK